MVILHLIPFQLKKGLIGMLYKSYIGETYIGIAS